MDQDVWGTPEMVIGATRRDVILAEIRDQFEGQWEQDGVSIATGLFCPESEDVTRQEFAEETDINKILKKFGGAFDSRPVSYGEYDFDVDLQEGIASIRAAQASWLRLPAEIRRRYPSWPQFLAAVEAGEVRYGPKPEDPKGSPAPSGGGGPPPVAPTAS